MRNGCKGSHRLRNPLEHESQLAPCNTILVRDVLYEFLAHCTTLRIINLWYEKDPCTKSLRLRQPTRIGLIVFVTHLCHHEVSISGTRQIAQQFPRTPPYGRTSQLF